MGIKNTQNWSNFGDINFYDYGGCLVKRTYEDTKYPELASVFDVIQYIPEVDDDENHVAIGIHSIDIDEIKDNAELKHALLYAVGLEEHESKEMFDIMSPENWAKELAEYRGLSYASSPYSIYYGGSKEDFLVSKTEAVQFMRTYGVSSEISGFYSRIIEEWEETKEKAEENGEELTFVDFLREKYLNNKTNPPEVGSDELDISDITDEEVERLLEIMDQPQTVCISDIKVDAVACRELS